MKRFEISYNPYNNRIHFRVAIPIDEENVSDWRELQAESGFMEFQNEECVFENIVDKILRLVNCYINTTESLEIVFKGTTEDFEVLQNAVYSCMVPNARKITCTHADVYLSSNTALERITRAFSKVEKDFNYYFSTYPNNNEINENYLKYKETVKPEIPVCFIGVSGVEKANIINAFIGMGILPSQTNGISTIIRNSNEYRIEFNYLNVFYVITIEGKHYSVKTPLAPDNEMISALFFGCDSCTDEKEIVNLVLARMISKNAEEEFTSKLNGCVFIYVPFHESLLNTSEKYFSFIDTTVQFLGEEDDFGIVYDDIILNQTNALPIVVATRDVLISDELFDLKRVIDEMGPGFARPNNIITLSKADELVSSQMKNDIPDIIREGIANPTIFYVSPEIALKTIQDNNNEINKTNKALLRLNISQYNVIPRNQNTLRSVKYEGNKLLYASGIPSLELELNYYATHFADYKKCANGQHYLLDAINKLVLELKKIKVQFENELRLDNIKRKEEQRAIRSEILGSIGRIQKPNLNLAYENVSLKFKPVLDEYCAGVPNAVRSCWKRVGNRPNDVDNLAKEMRKHCQENLYDRNSDSIKSALQVELLRMTSDYFKAIETYLKTNYDILPNDTKKALQALLDKEPRLVDVKIEPCVEISINNPIYLLGSDESKITYYSAGFEDQLKPNGKRLGHFFKQCIFDPTAEYSKQLNRWIELRLSEISKLFDSDQIILSRYDDRIEELEDAVDDLEGRIDNLTKVQVLLSELLPPKKER